MRFLQDTSIRRKQMLIIMLTSSVALLLACAAFVAYDIVSFRKAMVGRISSLAEMIGNSSTAAIDYFDPKAAEEMLAALRSETNMVAACVYDRDGRVFAIYERDGDKAPFVFPRAQDAGHEFIGDQLRLFQPVAQRGEVIGTIFLASDLNAISERLARHARIVGLVFLGSLLVAFGLSSRLERVVSGPILHLAQVARSVALEKNYSVRATKQSGDELGELIDGFNEMLAQIQQRDGALQAARDTLEQRVQERTRELAGSLSLLNATLESTADGILVVDRHGRATSHNAKFAAMWRLPRELTESRDDDRLLAFVLDQLKDGDAFLSKVRELYEHPEAESHDLLEFKDGRVFERYSLPQRLDGACVGRVWCFRDITERKQAEVKLEEAHRDLVQVSRQAGMAEVATSVLHNVGNVLNSVNTSASVIVDHVRRSKVSGVNKIAALLEENRGDLAGFLTREGRADQVINYLKTLAQHVTAEQAEVLNELQQLTKNIEHIKEIVVMQQNYAKLSGVAEIHSVPLLVEDALRMHAAALVRHDVRVVRKFEKVPDILLDKHKLLQILVNLISNAKYALSDSGAAERILTLGVSMNGDRMIRIAISDNGVGIARENLTRIFSHGFTTRRGGHGFGLHSGFLAVREMGGSLQVQSDGPGKGATFTLALPAQPEAQKP